MTEQLDQAIADEALMPDLSDDTFQICGETVRIKPFKILYQTQFLRLVNPILQDGIRALQDTQSWVLALARIGEYPEAIPKIIHLMCENDGKKLTLEQIDQVEDMDLVGMSEIIMRMCQKNERIAKPVLDFFLPALPKFREAMTGLRENMMLSFNPTPASNESGTMTASKPHVSDTDGLSNESSTSPGPNSGSWQKAGTLVIG